MSLTPAQNRALDITEKAGSILSLLGAAFVITTFLSSSKFRNPINRLVFIASWGNVLTNVATLIGTSAIGFGTHSSLCQFQAFMIQWFMSADAYWTFAMALNVYLSFYHHYDANDLRRLEWKYIAGCYGVPFIPAVAYCFVWSSARGRVYGNAVLWCWVSVEWDFLRIATFYGPAWIVILLTMGIYTRVGLLILQLRHQLGTLRRYTTHGLTKGRSQETPETGIRRTDEFMITLEDRHDNLPVRSLAALHHNGYSENHSPRFAAKSTHSQATSSTASRSPNTKANKAAVKYFKCALLFFAALLCTWVPSSVNRIYTLLNPNVVPFGPSYAAGLVLPLQGFWNFVVYITTSLHACRCLWSDIASRLKRRRGSSTDAVYAPSATRQLSTESSRYGYRISFSEVMSLKKAAQQMSAS